MAEETAAVSGQEEDALKPSEPLIDANNNLNVSVKNEMDNNGVDNGTASPDETQEQLTQMVMELGFQIDYMKAQMGEINDEHIRSVETSKGNNGSGQVGDASDEMKRLYENIECLTKEIQEQRETQKAAENDLEHLRVSYSEADAKVQELSTKLVEAQQKMEQEIKERDNKYVDLDTKFGRLHKRAKQRIQELQKEKDDLEARINDINVKAEQASNQQVTTQKELEGTRQQANEALRSMDAERQQLRTANNKLRDTIDELRRSLEAKENALEQLQQSFFEKEQLLEETRGLLHAGEEKRQASITELSAKHQKQLENLEAQLADTLSERSKAAATISSLQVLLCERDSKIAEMDAASTGEVVRLGAALEDARLELIQLGDKHEQEKQNWEAVCQAFRTKLEASESACLRSEIEAAKMRSQLELEISTQKQLLSTRDVELVTVRNEITRIQVLDIELYCVSYNPVDKNHKIKDLKSEFLAYKDRAHALLQKKDAEISAAKDSELFKAQEEALNEAETELAIALAERDKAIQDFQDVLSKHDKEIAERDAALNDVGQQIRSLTMKLNSSNARYISDKEAWQKNLESTEEDWKFKYGKLEAQKTAGCINDQLQKDLEYLKLQYKKLKEEHDAFRDIADIMIEEKETEIYRLLEDNNNLHRSLELKPSVDYNDNQNSGPLKQDIQNFDIVAAEQQILLLARQQAQREEELAQSQRHILALQDEIEELERENRLHSQQEAMLKAELRNMDRSQRREGVDMTYLKNVILKLLETGEVEALLPVVGTLLQFSPEEIVKCQQAYLSPNDVSTPASSRADAASSPSSLFSRFSFS